MPGARQALPAALALLLSAGCAPGARSPATLEPIRHATGMADAQVAARYIRSPRPDRFSVCHEHTCHAISGISLDATEWAQVRSAFSVPAPDAAAERVQIAAAVATLERIVGARTGTLDDQGRNFAGLGRSGQMDCVDEATNTTAYLIMMQQDGLLRWHRAGPRLSRGLERLLTLHFTATVDETTGGARYTVDSWFEANGHPPHIVPIAQWLQGWQPPRKSVESDRDSRPGAAETIE